MTGKQRVARLTGMSGIGVDRMGAAADRLGSQQVLRLENLDTDIPPHPSVFNATAGSIREDDSNSYLPFLGSEDLRKEAAALVSRLSGVEYEWNRTTIICAGGLNGILNVLLALLEPGDEVLMPDPIYIGLINRVRLAGGIPVFLPCSIRDGAWKIDIEALPQVITSRTRIFLMMSPVMPSGAVFTREDWEAICDACNKNNAWMLYDSAMERILFDDAPHLHPAMFAGMADRTITVGSVSKEYRMIGWRIGWIVAPPSIVNDIGLVNISNVVCPVGIAQAGAVQALRSPESDLRDAVLEWQNRRDAMVGELAGLPFIRPQGGWSLLVDTSVFGVTAADLSAKLLEGGGVAATAMTGWGSKRSECFLRFVFSNEPAQRYAGLRRKVLAALP